MAEEKAAPEEQIEDPILKLAQQLEEREKKAEEPVEEQDADEEEESEDEWPEFDEQMRIVSKEKEDALQQDEEGEEEGEDDEGDEEEAEEQEEEVEEEEEEEEDEAEEEEEEEEDDEKLFTVKINKEERKVTLDDLVENYEKGVAASERFQEAARLNKEVKAIFENFSDNPMGVMQQLANRLFEGDAEKSKGWVLGHAAKVLSEYEEEMALPEEQREARHAKAEAERLRQENERLRQEHLRRQQAEQQRAVLNDIATKLTGILARKKLQPDSEVGHSVILQLDQAIQSGHIPTEGEILALVDDTRDRITQERRERLKSLTVDDLEELPKEVRKQLRQRNVKRLKKGRSAKAGKGKRGQAPKPSAQRPRGAESIEVPELHSAEQIHRWEEQTGMDYFKARERAQGARS